jgi:hypothetical protein
MPPAVDEPPLQKTKRAQRTITLAEKLWFLNEHDAHPEWKPARLATEFKAKFGGALLSTSTMGGWLRPEAIQKLHAVTRNRGWISDHSELSRPSLNRKRYNSDKILGTEVSELTRLICTHVGEEYCFVDPEAHVSRILDSLNFCSLS